MASSGFLASLNLGTLVVVLIIMAIAFALFMKRRSNRHSMDGRQERNIAADLDAQRPAPDHSRPK